MNTQESTCDGEGTLNLHAPASTSISHSESWVAGNYPCSFILRLWGNWLENRAKRKQSVGLQLPLAGRTPADGALNWSRNKLIAAYTARDHCSSETFSASRRENVSVNATKYWLKSRPFKSFVRHFSCTILQFYNSSSNSARELFQPSTDSASLVVKIEKNNFRFWWGGFCKWRHKEDMFWKFRPSLAGPGPQPIDPLFWLKALLQTRWKSASIESLIDLL